MMNKEILLKAERIEKAFYDPMKVQILKGVDLLVRRGDTIASMGRSGEGKSA
jgi:lipoprotein-releasing system ATP-binding protein